VKPDVPLAPDDNSFLNAANGVNTPQIAASYSDFNGVRTYYVFAYSDGSNMKTQFSPSDFGIDRPVYLYDYFAGAGRVVKPTDNIEAAIANDMIYWVAAPMGPSGIAILGDLDQFVSMGKKRITDFSENGTVRLTVAFAPGEQSRTLTGYAPVEPTAGAFSGSVGTVAYDIQTQRFRVAVMPGRDGSATIEIRPGPRRYPGRSGTRPPFPRPVASSPATR
jgi:hypothetical protein